MFMFKRAKHARAWEMLPANEDYTPRYTEEQREFMERELLNNPTEKRRVKERMLADIRAARDAGRLAYAEEALALSMSLNGWNRKRIVQDDGYWDEYQRVMIGQKVDRLQCLVGKTVPLKGNRK